MELLMLLLMIGGGVAAFIAIAFAIFIVYMWREKFNKINMERYGIAPLSMTMLGLGAVPWAIVILGLLLSGSDILNLYIALGIGVAWYGAIFRHIATKADFQTGTISLIALMIGGVITLFGFLLASLLMGKAASGRKR